MLRPANGQSLKIAEIVGPGSAADIAWQRFAALQALAERPGHGVADRMHTEPGLQSREPLADRVKLADSGHVQIRVAIVDDHEFRPAGSCMPLRGTLRRTGV